jgi:hypothetical protein
MVCISFEICNLCVQTMVFHCVETVIVSDLKCLVLRKWDLLKCECCRQAFVNVANSCLSSLYHPMRGRPLVGRAARLGRPCSSVRSGACRSARSGRSAVGRP